MDSLPVVEINSRAAERLRAGHLWVYQSDIRDPGEAQAGDLVRVVVRHGRGGSNTVGVAFYSSASLIRLRLITRREVVPDAGFWRERLLRALELRSRVVGEDTAYRVVFSEADGIPGLIVDRYGPVLSIQMLCAGADRLRDTWLDLLGELFSPAAIVERDDTGSRRLEGLQEQRGLVRGELSGPVEVLQGGLTWPVDPLEGQKTGAFLDQRENHQAAARYAQGRCLDVFCYQGGFGLNLKRGGAQEVLLIDQSERALEGALQAARRNGLEVRTQAANAFDFLHEQQKAQERYQVVALDPPAFAKNKDSVASAVRGYKEINLRAMHLLEEGGVLITCSCSYHLSPERFEAIVLDAARDAGRALQVLERRSQSRDHPERLGFPESRYLKCLFLRVL
jgi:23S rRNA (cytosine1962-C5)-methyltransferase